MSGHSKWSKIKRQKQTKDKQRGMMFSKLSRLITLATIEGGGIGDPVNNIRLRLAIEKAKHFNMPKENIQRAIENALSPGKNQIKEIVYEGFGPGGIALIIVAATDNPNRTSSEIRSMLERHGGKLGSPGSVLYLFQKCAVVFLPKTLVTEERSLEIAQNIDAFDIVQGKEDFDVFFPFENIGKVKEALGDVATEPPDIDYKPISIIHIEDASIAKNIITLIDVLEELDDVQKVYANFDMPQELITLLDAEQ